MFSLFKDEIETGEEITIFTDSEYVLKCCGYFGEKSYKNGWKNKKGFIANHELVKQIFELYHSFENVNVQHVKAHTGNTDEHTSGCLLVGDTQQQNVTKSKDGFIGASVDAYKRIYPPIAEAILRGEDVEISYVDFD